MLRAIKHAFASPRINAFKATSLTGACTVGIGQDDVYSAASASAGKSYLTLRETFSRAPIVVATPVKAVDNVSGAALIDADPTISLLSLKNHDGTNPLDGALHAFAIGYDSDDSSYYGWGRQNAPFSLKSSWNAARFEVFEIEYNDPTIVVNIGSHRATVTRNGAGDYTITFKRPFASDNVVVGVSALADVRAQAFVVSASATAVRVFVGIAGTGNDDLGVMVVVKGSDNPQYGYGHHKTARASDRLPRVVAGHISYSTGTPSITKGTGDFTVVDTGTGILTVDFVNPFARSPVVLVSQDIAGNVVVFDYDVDGLILNAFNNSGVLADPGDLHFMAFGFDDTNEYAI